MVPVTMALVTMVPVWQQCTMQCGTYAQHGTSDHGTRQVPCSVPHCTCEVHVGDRQVHVQTNNDSHFYLTFLPWLQWLTPCPTPSLPIFPPCPAPSLPIFPPCPAPSIPIFPPCPAPSLPIFPPCPAPSLPIFPPCPAPSLPICPSSFTAANTHEICPCVIVCLPFLCCCAALKWRFAVFPDK